MTRAGNRPPWDAVRALAPPVAVWAATRAVLLLCVFKVLVLPGPDVTSDVAGIYHGWYEVLKSGSFPQDDVTWQYPPAAALAVLSPACCPSWTTPRPSFCWPVPPTRPPSRCSCTRAGGRANVSPAPGCGPRASPCWARPRTPGTT